MSGRNWVVGGDHGVAAAERIYRKASDLVRAEGLDALDVDRLAAQLHCSRATIYRHAGGKARIRDVVLIRLAAGIVDRVRREVDGLEGAERVVVAITVALDQVRSDDIRHLLLKDSNMAMIGDLYESPLLSRLAAELTGITDHDTEAAQWLVRIVMSLVQRPPSNGQAERHLLERFVAPAFLTV
ncbi:TetR family transcriptional regulator [Mycolicibacterium sp. 120266]|uniref:TetR/AcrR family transcriptional regulator n=1 Tax=Mycolicibacterium sp. 120266 TaxID=3090601 RepID=UPI00299D3631|nr:TetR family transcriptional regulator [Mycolicibacterium sp. 120266]MDX1873913.1 TetR family transcriptional regulator [Mycolicibacterium sp. 120266]